MKLECLQPINKELDKSIAWLPTGSYFICDVRDTDIDVVLLVAEDVSKFLDSSWEFTLNSQYEEAKFLSARKGKFNLLLTNDTAYFKQMRIATELAIRFRLTSKQDRVDLFRAIKHEE